MSDSPPPKPPPRFGTGAGLRNRPRATDLVYPGQPGGPPGLTKRELFTLTFAAELVGSLHEHEMSMGQVSDYAREMADTLLKHLRADAEHEGE